MIAAFGQSAFSASIETACSAWRSPRGTLLDRQSGGGLGGVRRTAKVQTDWLDSPEVCADLKKGAFDFATIKDVPTTIYLVLPPEYLASHGTWLRIMVASILRPLLRSVEGRAVPTLFLLDEFAQLGHMEIIEDNYALMRGYGVKLWTIFQDLKSGENSLQRSLGELHFQCWHCASVRAARHDNAQISFGLGG